ncbi:MAG: cell division protein FtsZ [Candidatus Thermoplasmatota archaeon]|nr:cell division protein FtsZ [Candidatus Thermoplasmatota archaeon]
MIENPDSEQESSPWEGTSEAEIEAFASRTSNLIKVFGLGGAGSNTITRLYREKLNGVELIACNTDANHLLRMRAHNKILLGETLTSGQGAGGDPKIGEEAARESEHQIRELMRDAEIVFVTAGLGGGTGTGSIHYVAKMAKEAGILTIAVVTMPFASEGLDRLRKAKRGLAQLAPECDCVILIKNDKLLELESDLPLERAFRFADEVIVKGVRAITEVIGSTGLINLDLNDLREIMKNSGGALMGIGISSGSVDSRVKEAVTQALKSPFLDVDLSRATGVLVNVSGGDDIQLDETNSATDEVRRLVSDRAKIILGAGIDERLKGNIQVVVIATGLFSIKDLTEGAENDESGLDYIS